MKNLWMIFCGLLACNVGGVWAQEAAYYYHRNHKVQVEVQMDALVITDAPGKDAAAAIARGKRREISGFTESLVVETSATGIAELNLEAARLRQAAPQAHVQAILRKSGSSAEAPAMALTDQISFKLKNAGRLQALTARYGLTDVEPVDFISDTYTARVTDPGLLSVLTTANRMQESGDAEWATPLVEEQKTKRTTPNDPLFSSQWHLQNFGSNTKVGVAGNDLNVLPVWNWATGAGVNIAIADDGVQTTHPDLMANIKLPVSYDFNENDADPGPVPSHSHGTGCAGVAAGRWNNNVGITGVAPEAGIAALRILAWAITDAVEAQAIAWRYGDADPVSNVAVHSNSWGPYDDGRTLAGPAPLTEAALEVGANQGRDGKGIVYVWAAGNGRASSDNINKDGYANNPHVIAVGATNSKGVFSYYSEPGSSMLVNAPSSDLSNGDGIYTTDISGSSGAVPGDYRSNFGGTSAATPAVAGVIALMLQINPNLTYRDVMHILVRTATKNDPTNPEWVTNGAGRDFNHNYGFGRVDAFAAVAAAASWSNVAPLEPIIAVNAEIPVPVAIPDFDQTGVSFDIPVTASPAFVLEHVELEANIKHTFRGDLAILLQSPSGMISYLMLTASSRDSGDNYDNWRFRSVAHWGEKLSGTWRVVVADLYQEDIGQVEALTLRLRGYKAPDASVDLWTLY